jgi:hypothetical protein
MKPIFAISFAAVTTLAGCAPPSVVVRTQYVVPKVPATLYACPIIAGKDFPDPDKLTDKQVAGLIANLASNNSVCKHNIEGIRTYMASLNRNIPAVIPAK